MCSEPGRIAESAHTKTRNTKAPKGLGTRGIAPGRASPNISYVIQTIIR